LIKVFKGGKYMPKVKTLLITVLVIAFALSLSGCGMLLSRRAEPELAASLDGELPEWLLLSHRSEEAFATGDLLNPKDLADEEEDDVVTTPSSDQVASTQPAPSSTPSSTPSTSSPEFLDPKPGTREYMAWFAANGAKPPFETAMLEWFATTAGSGSYAEWKKQKDAEDAAGGDDGWFDDFGKGSPSGFGNPADDDD
jgi:hypothetical protein